ncbi:hypothetical protein KKF84_01790 [Myxococcota bacterium]|nr:hypothetical protein [Myxococcota bacterium]MBU1534017.1 hypothetical protein [Myxococcota bacterium]
MSSNTKKTKTGKEKRHKHWEAEPLPPSVRRRRRTSLYRHSPKSAMFDKVIIGFAVLIAFVMITTKGCDRSVKGLSKLFTSSDQQETPKKVELKHDEQ